MDRQYEKLTEAFEKILKKRMQELQHEAKNYLDEAWSNTLDELEKSIQQNDFSKAAASKLRLDLLKEVREKLEKN